MTKQMEIPQGFDPYRDVPWAMFQESAEWKSARDALSEKVATDMVGACRSAACGFMEEALPKVKPEWQQALEHDGFPEAATKIDAIHRQIATASLIDALLDMQHKHLSSERLDTPMALEFVHSQLHLMHGEEGIPMDEAPMSVDFGITPKVQQFLNKTAGAAQTEATSLISECVTELSLKSGKKDAAAQLVLSVENFRSAVNDWLEQHPDTMRSLVRKIATHHQNDFAESYMGALDDFVAGCIEKHHLVSRAVLLGKVADLAAEREKRRG